jgi:hypothetical protein
MAAWAAACDRPFVSHRAGLIGGDSRRRFARRGVAAFDDPLNPPVIVARHAVIAY